MNILVRCSGTALALGPILGTAQPASPALEPVEVTAQFRAQRLQDTPLAITVLRAGELDARGQENLAQIAPQLPNVVLVPGGSAYGPSLGAWIRGIGQQDFNPAYEPGVGIHVDGVYYPTLTGSMFDLFDIERVEVLRGPQGTLAGRNSIGGAINIVTSDPDGETDGRLDLAAGTRGNAGLRVAKGLRWSPQWSGRIAAVHRVSDGFVSRVDYGCARPGNAQGIAATRPAGDCTVQELGGENHAGLRIKARYLEGPRDLVLTADYSRIRQPNPAEVVTFTRTPDFLCGPSCNFADYNRPGGVPLLGSGTPPAVAGPTVQSSEQRFEGGGAAATFKLALGAGTALQSITAHRRYRSTFGSDDDMSALATGAGGNNLLEHRFTSQELRLNGRTTGRIDWTVGAFFSRQSTRYYTQQDIRYSVPGSALQFTGDDAVDAGSRAVYATALFAARTGMNVTAGLRYNSDFKDYHFTRRNFDGTINAILDPVGAANASGYSDPVTGARALDGSVGRFRGTHLDWRLSADWRAGAQLMAYASIATGYKGGGISARPFNARQAIEGVFGPETVRTLEAGFKSDLFDRKLRLNAAVFGNRHRGVQLPLRDCADFGGGPCGVVANAGDARDHGIELEAWMQPAAGWRIDAAASKLRTRWERLDPKVGTSVAMSDPATSAPLHKASAGAQYTHGLDGGSSITWRVDASYFGSRFNGRAISATPYFLPPYRVMNARVTWRNARSDVELSLAVTNLRNEYYYVSRTDAVGNFTGNAYSRLGRPREAVVAVRLGF